MPITHRRLTTLFASDNVGKLHFVSIQSAPSFSNSFPQIYGTRSDVPCLIPCAIDQDPYFRQTRDVAARLKYPKPSLIHSKFFPSLQGPQTKMSASNESSSIYMTDTAKQIKKKINSAFSGGQETVEEHKRLGGNPDVDVAYQYMLFFVDSDEEMAELAKQYRAGELLSGEMKARAVAVLQQIVIGFQERLSKVSDDLVRQYMDKDRKIDGSPSKPGSTAHLQHESSGRMTTVESVSAALTASQKK